MTTYNNAQVALTGQALSGTLAIGGTGFTGKTLTNSWTQPGKGFETYNPSLTSNQLVPLSAADLAKPTLSFYDGTAEALTLTDNATVGPPPGVQGSTTPVSASSVSFTVEKPTATWTAQAGFIQQFTLPDHPGYTYWGLYQDPQTSEQYGMDWSHIVFTMPPGFSLAGQGSFTQLVTPNRTATANGQTEPELASTMASKRWIPQPTFNHGVFLKRDREEILPLPACQTNTSRIGPAR